MGQALCQMSLGELYAEGEGVRRNYTEAYKWFNLAASRPIALKNPGPYDLATYEKGKKTYRERRDEVAKSMSTFLPRTKDRGVRVARLTGQSFEVLPH